MITGAARKVQSIHVCVLLNQDAGTFKGVYFGSPVKRLGAVESRLVEDTVAFSYQILQKGEVVVQDYLVDNGITF